MAVKLRCPQCSFFNKVRADYRQWIKDRLSSTDKRVSHSCKNCDNHFSGNIDEFLKIYPYQFDKNGC